MSGYPIPQFVVKPSEEFICGICYDVLNNPHQCSNGHPFCHSCLTMSLQRRKNCPTCNVFMSEASPIKSLVCNQLIQKMEVKCSAHCFGCDWTGPLDSLSHHTSSCGHVLVDCPLFKAQSACSCNGKISRLSYYGHVADAFSNSPELLSTFIPPPAAAVENVSSQRGDYVGDKVDGKPHGQGVSKIDDTTYRGDFVSGEKSGYGVFTCPEYTAFGEWLNDKLHGECVVKYINGGCYKGDMKDGEKSGKGEMKYVNGSVYSGSWLNDKRHGEGVLTCADGAVYTGGFVDDIYSGTGTMKFVVGKVYEGQFLAGLYHGQGTLSDTNGNHYAGTFTNGQKHGFGVWTFVESGEVYRGNFKNDKRHGQCIIRYKNGNSFEGEYAEDKRLKGVFRFQSGHVYEGSFLNNLRHGKGTYFWPDKDIYTGDWVRGNRTGTGVFTYAASGNVYNGEFQDDKRHGEGVLTDKNGKEIERGRWENDVFVTPPSVAAAVPTPSVIAAPQSYVATASSTATSAVSHAGKVTSVPAQSKSPSVNGVLNAFDADDDADVGPIGCVIQ